MRKLIARLLVLLAVAGAVAGAFYLVRQIPDQQDQEELALAEVKRGDLTVQTYFRGELRAVRSLTLTAPNLGSQSQITALAPAGSLARRGDLIVELDDSERVAALEDDMLSVQRIEEQLKQAETELEIRKMQDDVDLVRSNFQVRRAELEVQRNELISAIDARKNELTLEEAKRRKAKLEEDIKNRLAQREAELAVLREQLNKEQLDVKREQERIDSARVLAPISGLVSILENRSGGRGGFGTTTPTVQEGDQVPAGLAVAQLLDLSEMELVAKVEELERANLREGQEALIRLDALPGKVIHGKIKRLGSTAAMNVFRGEATKKFDCILGIDMEELLEAVGASEDQVRRILATAEQNRQQGFGARPRASGGAPGGAGGANGGPGGGNQDVRARLQQMLGGRQMSELSEEERQQIRQRMQQMGGGQGRQGGGRRNEAAGQGPGAQGAAAPGGQAQRGARQGRQGGQAQPGAQAGGQRGGRQGGQGQPGAQAGGPGGQGGRQGGGRQASPEMRQRLQEMLGGRQMSELSDEERQQMRQRMQQMFQQQGGQGGGQRGGQGGRPQGGVGGGPGGAPPSGASRAPQAAPSGGGSSGFTKQQRENAQLPSPPEEGSDIDILLRPGLLADAEVIVEKLEDVLYIPYQARVRDLPRPHRLLLERFGARAAPSRARATLRVADRGAGRSRRGRSDRPGAAREPTPVAQEGRPEEFRAAERRACPAQAGAEAPRAAAVAAAEGASSSARCRCRFPASCPSSGWAWPACWRTSCARC